MPVILRKFHENPSRLRQLSVIKKTKKFSKIGKIDKKLLKSSKNCYTGNIFKATKKQAVKGFDRACRKRLFGLCGGRVLVCRSMAGSPISICLRIRFDRAIFAALCLRLCVLLCLYVMGLCVVMIFAPVRDPDRSLPLLWRHAYGFECFCVFMFAFYGSLCFALLKLTVAASLYVCF